MTRPRVDQAPRVAFQKTHWGGQLTVVAEGVPLQETDRTVVGQYMVWTPTTPARQRTVEAVPPAEATGRCRVMGVLSLLTTSGVVELAELKTSRVPTGPTDWLLLLGP